MKQFLYKGLFILFLICGLSNCAVTELENTIPSTSTNNEVTILVNIPYTQIPVTRSGENDESAISSVDILIFESAGSGSPEVLAEHARGRNITVVSESGNNAKVKFKTWLDLNAKARTVVIIANASKAVSDAINATGIGEEKQDVLAALTYDTSTNTTPIPMYGEKILDSNGITTDMQITDIELIRMLARIDIINNATGFTLSEVYLVNYNTVGYIAPAWDTTNGMLEDILPESPMIPTNADPQKGETNALIYPFDTNENQTELKNVIYTNEAIATSGIEGESSHIDAICLIIKGVYNNESYYYRIDFTSLADTQGRLPGETGYTAPKPEEIKYMPVFRNFHYTFSIGEVNGRGHTELNHALSSLGVMNNLKTSLLVVNESGTNTTVFNGQHYLSTVKETTLRPSKDEDGTLEAVVPCTTNYTGGWQIEKTDAEWLKAIKDDVPTAKKANIRISAIQDNYAGTERIAYVHLIAGRLTHQIKVVQQGAYIRVTDLEGYDIDKLLFYSKNSTIGKSPKVQQFKVQWEPISTSLTLDKTKTGDYIFNWQDVSTNSLAVIPAGGSYTFSIDPTGISQEEVNNFPFCIKESLLTFISSADSDVTADVTLNQTHFQLIPEEFKNAYPNVITPVAAIVKSNADWKISINNPSYILSAADWQGGVGNTLGTPYNYTFNGTTVGKVDFTFSTVKYGLFDDVTITVGITVAQWFARSNIVWDNIAGKLIFAETAEDNINIPANVQGVYFKWGSLFPLSPVGKTFDVPSQVLYTPEGFEGTPPNGTGNDSWYTVPFVYAGESYEPPFNNSDAIEDDFRTYNDGQGYDVKSGLGDICRYISDKKWVKGRWRMPTNQELRFLSSEYPSVSNGGSFENIGSVPDENKNAYGYYQPLSGRWFGVAMSGKSSDSETAPSDGVIYLPAGGYRDYNWGIANYTGYYGKCWSASSYNYNISSAGSLQIRQGSGAGGSSEYTWTGLPVRCILDWNNEE